MFTTKREAEMNSANPQPSYTEGPWEVNEYGQLASPCGDSLLVAGGVASPLGSTHPRMKEAQANARLISAAPDLLAALEAFLNENTFYCDWVDKHGIGKAEWDYRSELVEEAKAAIAKATGKK